MRDGLKSNILILKKEYIPILSLDIFEYTIIIIFYVKQKHCTSML